MGGGVGAGGTRWWLALALVTLLAVAGGALRPISASAAGAKKPASSTATAAAPTATVAATPTVGSPGAGSLSGFPAPPVATTSSTPTVVNTSTGSTAGSSSFSSSSALAIVISAVVILLGISFFIWRDARRRAPVPEGGSFSEEGRARSGSKRPPKPRKLSPAERKRRKRGKTRR